MDTPSSGIAEADTFSLTLDHAAKDDFKYCFHDDKWTKSCYKRVGNKLIYKEKPDVYDGEILKNGDIKWGNWISRIIDPCPMSCNTSWDMLVGQKIRTWDVRDKHRLTIEEAQVTKERDQICIKGSLSAKNCYERKGNWLRYRVNSMAFDRMTPSTDNSIWAHLQPNGEILWSHGYRSAPLEGTCSHAPACEAVSIN
jgi:hypothetical protein